MYRSAVVSMSQQLNYLNTGVASYYFHRMCVQLKSTSMVTIRRWERAGLVKGVCNCSLSPVIENSYILLAAAIAGAVPSPLREVNFRWIARGDDPGDGEHVEKGDRLREGGLRSSASVFCSRTARRLFSDAIVTFSIYLTREQHIGYSPLTDQRQRDVRDYGRVVSVIARLLFFQHRNTLEGGGRPQESGQGNIHVRRHNTTAREQLWAIPDEKGNWTTRGSSKYREPLIRMHAKGSRRLVDSGKAIEDLYSFVKLSILNRLNSTATTLSLSGTLIAINRSRPFSFKKRGMCWIVRKRSGYQSENNARPEAWTLCTLTFSEGKVDTQACSFSSTAPRKVEEDGYMILIDSSTNRLEGRLYTDTKEVPEQREPIGNGLTNSFEPFPGGVGHRIRCPGPYEMVLKWTRSCGRVLISITEDSRERDTRLVISGYSVEPYRAKLECLSEELCVYSSRRSGGPMAVISTVGSLEMVKAVMCHLRGRREELYTSRPEGFILAASGQRTKANHVVWCRAAETRAHMHVEGDKWLNSHVLDSRSCLRGDEQNRVKAVIDYLYGSLPAVPSPLRRKPRVYEGSCSGDDAKVISSVV
ncbi:hypothetical protein JOM56_012199 [Amanita muscaria]